MSRNSSGCFLREHQAWTGANWDDGFVDNRGYFRVYSPAYPRAYADGNAKRSHVVWWLYTGDIFEADEVIHHANKNKLNDCIGNLECHKHGEHSKQHQHDRWGDKHRSWFECVSCGKHFSVYLYVAKKGGGHYCSRKCTLTKGRAKAPERIPIL